MIGDLRRMWVTTRVSARVVDPRHRPLPHIVVIGAQRSGTTSLYELLAGHPQVRPPVRKEIQFLSIRWDRGLPWYRRHFPVLSDASLRTCEASPYYLFHPSAPVRAAAALPDTKFIALLREPSTRAISHYVAQPGERPSSRSTSRARWPSRRTAWTRIRSDATTASTRTSPAGCTPSRSGTGATPSATASSSC